MRLGEEVKPLLGGEIKLWRRTVIIIAANCFGLLIAGGVLGFFSIIWDTIIETDKKIIKSDYEIKSLLDSELTKHNILLQEIAILRAESNNKSKKLEDFFSDLDMRMKNAYKKMDYLDHKLEDLAKNDKPYSIMDSSILHEQPLIAESKMIPEPEPILILPKNEMKQKNIAEQKPSVSEVLEAQEMIQQKIDKAEYRNKSRQ